MLHKIAQIYSFTSLKTIQNYTMPQGITTKIFLVKEEQNELIYTCVMSLLDLVKLDTDFIKIIKKR